MPRDKMKYVIRLIAIIIAATALYILLPTYWLFAHWFEGIQTANIGQVLLWLIFDLILIFKLISSYGLFKFRKWGWTVALYALFSDFLMRLAGGINARTYHLRHPEVYSKLQSNPPLPEYTVTHSMIPSYVIALLSLLLVIILLSRPVKESFLSNSHKKTIAEKA